MEDSKGFSLKLLSLIKESQQLHGLKHEAYEGYHQYISRKLRRMRHALHIPQGTKNKVTPRRITPEMVKDSRYLQLKLFEAERAWAHFMNLRQLSADNSMAANSESRKRFHAVQRLAKSIRLANELCELAAAKADAQTQLETRAYADWLTGQLYIAKRDWSAAQHSLASAQKIYSGLAERMGGADAEEDDAEQQAQLYRGKLDEIEPMLRLCRYQLGDKTTNTKEAAADLAAAMQLKQHAAPHDEQISALLAQCYEEATTGSATTESSVATPGGGGAAERWEVCWLGLTIPIRQEKVRLAVRAMKQASEELLRAGLPGNNKTDNQQQQKEKQKKKTKKDGKKGGGSNNREEEEEGEEELQHHQEVTDKQQRDAANAKISVYERILKVVGEAIGVVRDELSASKELAVLVQGGGGGGAASGGGGVAGSGNVAGSAAGGGLQLDKLSRNQLVYLYLDYARLTKTIERDVIMSSLINESAKPADAYRLQDTMKQHLQMLANTLSVSSSPQWDCRQEIQTRIECCAAQRCFHLAGVHLAARQFSNAASLLVRAKKRALGAIRLIHELEKSGGRMLGGLGLVYDRENRETDDAMIAGPSLRQMAQQMEQLCARVEQEQLVCKATRCLALMEKNGGGENATTANEEDRELLAGPLYERLDDYVEDPNLINSNKKGGAADASLSSAPASSSSTGGGNAAASATSTDCPFIRSPPEYRTIPAKPIFFDLAANLIEFPNLDKEAGDSHSHSAAAGGSKSESSGKGIGGFVRSWLPWGGGSGGNVKK